MDDILQKICARRKIRLAAQMCNVPLAEVRKMAEEAPERPSFYEALKKPGLSCICEVKKASPSKGLIRPDFQPVALAEEYEAAGADCISCLTEEDHFQGSSDYLRDIAAKVKIPVLRKDFVVDEYMIYEAKALGASAVLLIAAVLYDSRLEDYFKLAHSLGMDCLVEVHTPEEVEHAQRLNPRILGVNNRNLRTFEVDLGHTAELAALRQEKQIFVSESGIKTNEDMHTVQDNGADAVLIGETLMRSDNITETLHALREGTR
ncbi:MAG: indole-3-glycerol phosphate synthase TrpC [Oscillospiraceae bacterium]|nr:indole-3-glycerol phosphate synthase TrpC [Oscillospiraceae bacterium]